MKTQSTRHGVILVVVLSMLSLFSVLIASYVIFSSQVAGISDVQRFDVFPINDAMESALSQLISGTTDHQSAAFGNSLLEDLYGTDGMILRVGNDRSGGGGMPGTPLARGLLVMPVSNNFFKIPTSLASWHNDNDPRLASELSNLPTGFNPNMDDAVAGRFITFMDGPLANHTFQVLRSFGGSNVSDTSADPLNVETNMAGSMIIDLDQGPIQVQIDGVDQVLTSIASSNPNSLLYNLGDDELPGIGGVDDDGDTFTDEDDEAGSPGSDDIGYPFILNGTPFNGRGQNPVAATGLYRGTTPVDLGADVDLQLNARLMGANARGGDGTDFSFPEQDEPWDAADFENIFLAWQPSDHRSVSTAEGLAINSGLPATMQYSLEEREQLGSRIIPSFHRPALINYLMNSPIRMLNGTTDGDTFWDLKVGSGAGNDPQQLIVLMTRIRRATLRPLPFQHSYFGADDLDGDGLTFDGTPRFLDVGEPGFVQAINSTDFATNLQWVEGIARWLTNGPWDVDNDFDGIPDSVWVDLKLPIYTTNNFDRLRPMVAVLIEDLDGKVNINEAGSHRQLLTRFFPANNPTTIPTTSFDADYLNSRISLNSYGRGGGVGPAELHFGHMFEFGSTSGAPSLFTQTSAPRTWLTGSSLLWTRYGNLLNRRYGGSVFDYNPMHTIVAGEINLPGSGDGASIAAGSDLESTIPFPARTAVHAINTAMGRPMDLSGIARTRRDRFGNETFDNLGTVTGITNIINELTNQPYENGLTGDTHFTPDELVSLIAATGYAQDLGTLLEDELQRNGALKSLLTTNSQMIDVPETPGDFGIVGLFARRMGSIPNLQLHLDRMLAPELRKGGKLNLNRALGNGQNDTDTQGLSGIVDDSTETSAELVGTTLDPDVHNRESPEPAFPQISSTTQASYAPVVTRLASGEPIDFDGTNDRDGDGLNESIANGNELLARQLYCLMYFLTAGDSTGAERFPNFPYPDGFSTNSNIRNRYAARRIAQWAVNAVDFRDTNAICTRLRYDPNPLDGFDLDTATSNVVWGMERPEIEISESLAYHDKRLRRNLETSAGATDADGQLADDEAPAPLAAGDPDPDEDMDQFRIPEAGAFVELRSLRSPNAGGSNQPSLPLELYTSGADGRLDLGRTVGTGTEVSPVWRLAVGEAVQGDAGKSIVWNYDAQRMSKIVEATTRTDHIDYLTANAPADWTDTTTNVDDWREVTAWSAEVRPSMNSTGAFVTIADDDFDPTNDATSQHRVQLTRFVWFANLVPDSTALDILTDVRSGMTPSNVFYNRLGVFNAPTAPAPQLAPGQFAVIAPRPITTFGQTVGAAAPTFDYSPSPQQISLVALSTDAAGTPPGSFDSLFRVDYEDLSGSVLRPPYAVDGTSGTTYADFTDYRVHNVLPIIAQSLYPDQVSGAATAWQTYRTTTAADVEDQVGIGFNISAPLTGANYYDAPTYRIDGTTEQYPLVDGYRDYVASAGLHPDQPFDYEAGAPLITNGWAGVGTHQEAVGIFLQRLADPTIPWHAVDNPYITVDLAPMDLTVMNGEGDVTEAIDREGDGAFDDLADDIVTTFDGTNFAPPVRFDSRRKVPNTSMDRPATVLMTPTGGSSSLAAMDRQIYTERPGLSSSFSLLRDNGVGVSTPAAAWSFQLGSMWNASFAANDASINSIYGYDANWAPFHPRMDRQAQRYRQTLGFINREYGRPNDPETDKLILSASASIVRGSPNETIFKMPGWADRDFQSPMDLIHIPATSRSGLGRQVSPGTIMDYSTVSSPIEIDAPFEHLLGFERNFGRTATESTIALSSMSYQALPLEPPTDEDAAETGERTPFEVILDVASTGAESYDDRQWFNEANIKFFPDPGSGNLTARQRMFNRVVELFQPPYNHMPAYRKAGRINLNTTPDYIRKGGAFSGGGNVFLDQAEGTASTAGPGANALQYASLDRNQGELGTLFGTSPLMGNGSVYRSFGWAMSDPYDLDLSRNRPTLEGHENGYLKTVDSPYGFGFKAFIESRRGYEDTTASTGTNSLRNPFLSSFYPTQFAGVFSTPMAAQSVPSVQRFMPFKQSGTDTAVRRRTQDMTVFRPNPDADERIQPTPLATLRVETAAGGAERKPINGTVPAEVTNLQMSRDRYGLFERSLPELHQNYRHRARESEARFENASRIKNTTTGHSNVFLVRMTVGFFEVDPLTGEVRGEYVDPETNTTVRGRGSFTIDRSIPVGFMPGEPMNQSDTILSKYFAQ